MSGDHNMHCSANQPTKCTRCGEVNPAEIHTCSPQTKALRLAENLAKPWTIISDQNKAAAELRRLDALNAELVAALYGAVDSLHNYCMVGDASEEDADNLATALAVLAKAKEQT